MPAYMTFAFAVFELENPLATSRVVVPGALFGKPSKVKFKVVLHVAPAPKLAPAPVL